MLKRKGDFVITSKKKGRPSKRPSNEELSMLYSSMTAKEIATHYGVALSTVKTWIRLARKEDAE